MKIFTYIVIGWGCFLILLIVLLGLASENTTYYMILDILWIAPTGLGGFLLITVASLLYGIIHFIVVLIKERKILWLSFAPFVSGLIFLVFIKTAGSNLYVYLTEKAFERNFAVFNQMVEDARSEKLISSFSSYRIKDNMKPQDSNREEKNGETLDISKENNIYHYMLFPKNLPVRNISWTKDEKGVTIIKFATTGQLPYTRGGFMYIAGDNPNQKMIEDYRMHKIKPCWYRWFFE